MHDPLTEVIALLRPRTVYSKRVSGSGPWATRMSDSRQASFFAVLEGGCRVTIEGGPTLEVEAGDFVLLPAPPPFVIASRDVGEVEPLMPGAHRSGEVHYGPRDVPPDVRMLGGYFVFESPDADLMVTLLPPLVHVRGVERLALLVGMLADESAAKRPGHELVLARLVEIMLVEALRSTSGADAPPGPLRGLADARIAPVIRALHTELARAWSVVQLAKVAGLSRSTFFERFTRAVGVTPMEYLLARRMAVARDLLRRRELGVAEVAERVGYTSTSTFSTAFSRHVGQPPGRYARAG